MSDLYVVGFANVVRVEAQVAFSGEIPKWSVVDQRVSCNVANRKKRNVNNRCKKNSYLPDVESMFWCNHLRHTLRHAYCCFAFGSLSRMLIYAKFNISESFIYLYNLFI